MEKVPKVVREEPIRLQDRLKRPHNLQPVKTIQDLKGKSYTVITNDFIRYASYFEGMTDGAFRLYIYLLSYLNSEEGYAYPSQNKMAQDLKCSPSKIRRHLTALKDCGLIEYDGTSTHGRNKVVYFFDIEDVMRAQKIIPYDKGSVGYEELYGDYINEAADEYKNFVNEAQERLEKVKETDLEIAIEEYTETIALLNTRYAPIFERLNTQELFERLKKDAAAVVEYVRK